MMTANPSPNARVARAAYKRSVSDRVLTSRRCIPSMRNHLALRVPRRSWTVSRLTGSLRFPRRKTRGCGRSRQDCRRTASYQSGLYRAINLSACAAFAILHAHGDLAEPPRRWTEAIQALLSSLQDGCVGASHGVGRPALYLTGHAPALAVRVHGKAVMSVLLNAMKCF